MSETVPEKAPIPRQLLQRIPKGIKRDSHEHQFYLNSFQNYTPIRKNMYLNRKMKLPTEEDIYVCDCISSESLINPSSPTYKRFVEAEEVKLWAKWKKKVKRKKGRQARKMKELKMIQEREKEKEKERGKEKEGVKGDGEIKVEEGGDDKSKEEEKEKLKEEKEVGEKIKEEDTKKEVESEKMLKEFEKMDLNDDKVISKDKDEDKDEIKKEDKEKEDKENKIIEEIVQPKKEVEKESEKKIKIESPDETKIKEETESKKNSEKSPELQKLKKPETPKIVKKTEDEPQTKTTSTNPRKPNKSPENPNPEETPQNLKSLKTDTSTNPSKTKPKPKTSSKKPTPTKSNSSKPLSITIKPSDIPPPELRPAQSRFVYSKMKSQVSPAFRTYLDQRIREIVKNDSNISIDCGLRCLNRLICTECEIKSCPVGQLCQNRRFQKQENKLVYPKPTPEKGWGLFAMETIRKGDFIIQYLGEIFSLTSQIGIKRRTEYSGSTCTYLMKLSPKEVIDPTKKGNVARFINHSCDPNCVTQKWNVMGEVFVGIFAKKDIMLNQELSFDYKFDVYKTPYLECFCKAYNCKGYLGLAGGNPNLRLNTYFRRPPPTLNSKQGALPTQNKGNLIELMSNKKSKKKSTFIIKKSQTQGTIKEREADLDFTIKPKRKRLTFEDKDDESEDSDDLKMLKNLRKSTKQRKQKLNARLDKNLRDEANEADGSQGDSNFRLNEKDVCEICKKSIYCDSDSENNDIEIEEERERKLNTESIPCTNCPANYHINCLEDRHCSKCGNDFITEGVNQIDLVAGDILNKLGKNKNKVNINPKRVSISGQLHSSSAKKMKKNIKKSDKKDEANLINSEDSCIDTNKSIDSDNLDWASQSALERSGKKARKESFDSRLRKGSENLSVCFTNNKSDFRTKKKQQFKMITDNIIGIFDKDLAESEFKQKYFDAKNKLKPLCSPESEPSSDFSNFYISPIELAVFKQRGTRIFLKQTQIHVFWNNSDISYKNFFARNTELRCGCRPEEKKFVSDLLAYIQRCVVTYRETSGTVENSFQIPAIFLKQVLGEYYRNSKFVEKQFNVKLNYDRMHVTDECYPIHFLTTLRLRGRSQNIQAAHTHITHQLRPLVARRKYMTREDIKIIISKLQQIKRNINPTEIRCCRDNALRDINHPFYTIYYKDKEVAFIGTKEQVMRAEKFVAQVIENNRRMDDNPLALNYLVPGGEKAELIHIKNKAEKKYPGNRMIIYDSLPPKRNSSLTLISSYRKFEDFVRFVSREINDSKICSMMFRDFQQEQLFQKAKSYFKNLMNYSLTKSFSFIKTWDSLSSEFGGEAVHFPSLYRFLQKRILNDPDFQFYLIYVNNLIKHEKGRLNMGLTNSVIFKILFIMLKKEDARFKEKSIFKDVIGKSQESKSLKKVKTESSITVNITPKKIPNLLEDLNRKSPEKNLNKKIQNLNLMTISKNTHNQHQISTNKHMYPHPSNTQRSNQTQQDTTIKRKIKQPLPPPSFPAPPNQSISYGQKQHSNMGYMSQRGQAPYHMQMHPMQSNMLHQYDAHQNIGQQGNMNYMSQSNIRSNLPVFQMPGNMIPSQGLGMSSNNPVYQRYGNTKYQQNPMKIVDTKNKSENSETKHDLKRDDNTHNKVGKVLEKNVLKKRASSGSRRERKSSLSDDTVSVSSSSISYSLDTKEESKKKKKSWRRKHKKKSYKKRSSRYPKYRPKYSRHRRRYRNSSSISLSISSSSSSEPPKKSIKRFQQSFTKMIESPDAKNLKRRLNSSNDSSSSKPEKSKSRSKEESETSRDEGEIVDREKLRNLTKKLKKKRKGKQKTKRIKKKRKGKSDKRSIEKRNGKERSIDRR